MAAAVPFMMAAAAAMSAVGAIQQGQAAKAAGNYNAAVAERNAGIARDQASTNAEAQQRHAARVLGGIRAGYGASGVTLEGSPLDVLESSAMNAELDRRNLLYAGELRATGYHDTAALERMKGDAAETGSYFKAGSEIILGAGRYAATRPEAKPTTGYQLGAYDYSSDGL